MVIAAGRTSPPMKRKTARIPAAAAKGTGRIVRSQPAPPLDSEKKPQAARVVRRLNADYPAATCALENETPFELLVATILSAQCTDERVNMVTPELFRRWPTAADRARGPIKELEKAIQSAGFFRHK